MKSDRREHGHIVRLVIICETFILTICMYIQNGLQYNFFLLGIVKKKGRGGRKPKQLF